MSFKNDSIPSLKQHLSIEKLDSYLIYTHAKPVPRKIDTLKEPRTCLRVCQSLVSGGELELNLQSRRFWNSFLFVTKSSLSFKHD